MSPKSSHVDTSAVTHTIQSELDHLAGELRRREVQSITDASNAAIAQKATEKAAAEQAKREALRPVDHDKSTIQRERG